MLCWADETNASALLEDTDLGRRLVLPNGACVSAHFSTVACVLEAKLPYHIVLVSKALAVELRCTFDSSEA